MPTYEELRRVLESELAAARLDLRIHERRVERARARYGRAFDCPERRVTIISRIAELELNLEALEYDRAAADPTL